MNFSVTNVEPVGPVTETGLGRAVIAVVAPLVAR